MRNYIYLLLLSIFLTSCGGGGGDQRIVDFTVISSLVNIHKKEHENYEDIKGNSAVNTGLQFQVTKQYEKYREVSEKIKKRYTEVNLIITEVGKIPRALKCINDIKSYQTQMLDLVVSDPKLSTVAIQTEIQILKRVTRLYKFVYSNALIGTKYNQMPIAERLRIIDYVLEELRVIRGFSYSIYRKMRQAKYGKSVRKVLKDFEVSSIQGDIDRRKIIENLKIGSK